MFLDNLPFLKKMEFEIGGFFQGFEEYYVEINGDEVKYSGIWMPLDMMVKPITTKEQLLEYIRGMHLEEWRRYYDPKRFGVYVLDGTQWSLTLEYDNGIRSRKFEGNNDYPWNFEDICRRFGIEWHREYSEENDEE